MNDSLFSSTPGLILVGYALGLTFAVVVIAALRGSTTQPAVVIERERDGSGCLPLLLVVGLFVVALALSGGLAL
jgi:hypothetical protein